MNRTRIPKSSPPEVAHADDGMIRQTRRYKVITPLFGGGVETQKADPVTVVRATEVRGHLRFWWRATRGGQFNGTLADMKKAEEAIWGSAAAQGKAGHSPILISLSNIQEGSLLQGVEIKTRDGTRKVDIGHPASPYSYVAFPLRAEDGKPAGSLRENVSFTLDLLYPAEIDDPISGQRIDLKSEVEAALWAWETFGGIGARTRRGFGALQCETDQAPKKRELENWLRSQLKTHVVLGSWPSDVPYLYHGLDFKLVPPDGKQTVDEAWRYLIDRLRQFRQARYPDRHGRPYGRSKWPEADEVRRQTGDHSPGHAPVYPVTGKTPRGRFGLPIIVQFKREDVRSGDPQPATLEGASHDRYASRLILRPIVCSDSRAFGLACVLQGPPDPPGGYVLNTSAGVAPVRADLTPHETKHIDPLNGNGNVLQAFLNYL